MIYIRYSQMQQKVKRTQTAYVGPFYLVSLCSVLCIIVGLFRFRFVWFERYALQMYTRCGDFQRLNFQINRPLRKTYFRLIVQIVSTIGLLVLIAFIE